MAYFGKLVVQLNQPKTPLRVSTAANIERSRRELSKSVLLSLRVLVVQKLYNVQTRSVYLQPSVQQSVKKKLRLDY